MHARYPRIDYSQVRPHWAPNREFAHQVNASSTIPALVEPWLIKVMGKARLLIAPSETGLLAMVDVFIAQEAQHYRQHASFNRRIREAYPVIARYEQQLGDDYAAMLDGRSLKFNLAYSEGFESLGPPSARMWFEHYAELIADADREAVALWKWHMAEEFEHREVCFRLFHALYCRTLWGRVWNGWLYRCYGFICAMRHLGAYSKAVAREMGKAGRTTMDEAARARSRANVRRLRKLTRKHFLPQLLKVFSPFYNPARLLEPHGLSAYLARFEKAGDMGLDGAV